MECAGVITEVVYKKESFRKSDYSIDLWKEVKRRWMVFGVLFSLMLAVLSPHVGAPGGPLRMEYISYAPLFYIYFCAGCRYRACSSRAHAPSTTSTPSMRSRVVLTTVLHAHVASPALCVVAVSAFQDVLDHRIIKGALFSSVGAPCGWLSLSLSHSSAAPLCVAASYVASLLAAPLAMLILCGRAAVPPVGPSITGALSALAPFMLGASRPAPPAAVTCIAPRVAALLLVYADACARLADAEGGMYVGDVLTTLCLELCYLSCNVLCVSWCRRGGMLSPRGARDVALCALPKQPHHVWPWSPQCGAWGAGALPAAVRAPGVALLLAALAGGGGCDC